MSNFFKMTKNYKNDKYYLANYYYSVIAVLVPVNLILIYFSFDQLNDYVWFIPAVFLLANRNFVIIVSAMLYSYLCCTILLGYSNMMIVYILAGILITYPAIAFLHNAAHRNFRLDWINRCMGEIIAVFHLVGFPDWHIVHNLHHSFPDDPERDPHPPIGTGFWEFVFNVREKIGRILTANYFGMWGDTEENRSIWLQLAKQMELSLYLKIVFWLLLLGPEVFSFFYTTTIVVKTLSYAHFNWRTHQLVGGAPTIVNLNHNLIYKFLNLISFGLYFHGNHHDKSNLFNPQKMG